jgi:hypothetical protein
MNFKEATDRLFDRVDHAELARALGVSVASIRQARLRRNAKAYREPPKGWEIPMLRLAERRVAHFRHLIDTLRERE